MKRIIFTCFLDLIKIKFGLETVDIIISESKLVSKGIYTAIGFYTYLEMSKLLQNLSGHTKISVDNLLLIYGKHFFSIVRTGYLYLLNTYKHLIKALSSIENHICVEVIKTCSKIILLTCIVEKKGLNYLIMLYNFGRAMYLFGLGLINKPFEHFNITADIKLQKVKQDGIEFQFIIHKN